MDRVAVEAGVHKAIVVSPALPICCSSCCLRHARSTATVRGSRSIVRRLLDVFTSPVNDVEVDVSPRQAGHPAAAHAGVGGKVDRRALRTTSGGP